MINIIDKLNEVNPWIVNNLLFITIHGSHAYGLNVETSDTDYKGISFAPKNCYLGFRENFEQQELKNPDTCIFELRKFFNLAIGCNPNCLEILFTDEKDHILVSTTGKELLDNRDLFISKRARFTFAGYAKQQLKRINAHRAWLLNPILTPPTRAEFGLKEKPIIGSGQLTAVKAEIKKEIDKYNLEFLDLREDQKIAVKNIFQDILSELKISKEDKFVSAAKKIGISDNLIEYFQKENAYDNKLIQYNQYLNWKKNRNADRAAMEAESGFDRKHGMHLIRLLCVCKELFETGKLNVKRTDREELLAIRNGEWSYEKLIEEAEKLESNMDILCAKSSIPDKPNLNKLDKLYSKLIEDFLNIKK